MSRFPMCLHGTKWDNFFSFLTLHSLYFMDINGQQLSRMLANTNCEKVKMVWKQGDKSCFTFLKYNDGHDSTFHNTLLSEAFKDMLQDKQYRYEHNLLRTSDRWVKPLLASLCIIAFAHVHRPTKQALCFIETNMNFMVGNYQKVWFKDSSQLPDSFLQSYWA